MLLLTLATRACLAVGGLSSPPASPIHLNSSNMTSLDGKEELWSNLNGLAILNPLAPHWQMLTEPGLWLEATIQVRITWRKEELSSDFFRLFSLFNWELGLSLPLPAPACLVTTRSPLLSAESVSKNLSPQVRDCLVISLSHLVWLLPSLLLTLALSPPSSLAFSPGTPLSWEKSIVFLHSSLLKLRVGWLWASLLLILILLASLSSLLGHLEVVNSSLQHFRPSLRPVFTLLPLALFSLLAFLLASQGGLSIHHLLSSSLTPWSALLTCLLTLLASLLCQGVSSLLSDLSEVSSLLIPNWTGVHLSFLFYTPLPMLLGSALIFSLSLKPVLFPWLAFALLPVPLAALAFTVAALRKRPLATVTHIFQ